jgi:hypothetical protein
MSLRPREINFVETWQSLLKTVKGIITLNRLNKVDRTTWNDKFSYPFRVTAVFWLEAKHSSCMFSKFKLSSLTLGVLLTCINYVLPTLDRSVRTFMTKRKSFSNRT